MKKLKHLLLTMILATFMIQPAMAGVLNDDDMVFAFGSPGVSSDLGEMALLSHQEMVDTEGDVAPFVAIGFLHGGRFIAQRWVHQRVAARSLARGCNIWCRSAQQSRAVANLAWGRSNVIRHGARHPHSNYSHFQNRSRSFRGHAFYGSRWR